MFPEDSNSVSLLPAPKQYVTIEKAKWNVFQTVAKNEYQAGKDKNDYISKAIYQSGKRACG